MAETVRQIVNRVFREYRRYTGDGDPNEPVGAPLPVGDPKSGPFNPPKDVLRDGLGQVGDDIEAVRFDLNKTYLGSKATAPTVDNNGDALIVGARYFDTSDDKEYIWNGSSWQVVTASADDVAFTPSGTGAVATTVDAQLDKVVFQANFGSYSQAEAAAGGALGSMTKPLVTSSGVVMSAPNVSALPEAGVGLDTGLSPYASHGVKLYYNSDETGTHPTTSLGTMAFLRTATGSGVNGPIGADFSLFTSIQKRNYLTSLVEGEVDAQKVVAYQGRKGDVGGLLVEARKVRTGTNSVPGDDTGGITPIEIAARWVNSTGTPTLGCQVIPGFMEPFGGFTQGRGIGQSVEVRAGQMFAAFGATAFDEYSAGLPSFIYALSFSTSRSESDVFFNVAWGTGEPTYIGTAWTAYTPTIASSGGSLTTASAIGHYKRVGKTLLFNVKITITTNGTGSGLLISSLPFAPVGPGVRVYSFAASDPGTYACLGATSFGGSTDLVIANASGGYPGADGKTIVVSGSYELP